MTRNVWISLLLMIAVTGGSALYFFSIADSVLQDSGPETEPIFDEAARPLYEPTDPPIEARMFFPGTSNDVLLRTQDVTIFASAEIENRVRQIVEKLIQGAEDEDLFGRLPDDTRLNEVFVTDNGIVYLDFNSALSDNHPGGVLPEQATIYSIVNSITYNVAGIDRVKILIGGNEKETLAGHCLLLLPLETDLSISDMAPIASLAQPLPTGEIIDEN